MHSPLVPRRAAAMVPGFLRPTRPLSVLLPPPRLLPPPPALPPAPRLPRHRSGRQRRHQRRRPHPKRQRHRRRAHCPRRRCPRLPRLARLPPGRCSTGKGCPAATSSAGTRRGGPGVAGTWPWRRMRAAAAAAAAAVAAVAAVVVVAAAAAAAAAAVMAAAAAVALCMVEWPVCHPRTERAQAMMARCTPPRGGFGASVATAMAACTARHAHLSICALRSCNDSARSQRSSSSSSSSSRWRRRRMRGRRMGKAVGRAWPQCSGLKSAPRALRAPPRPASSSCCCPARCR